MARQDLQLVEEISFFPENKRKLVVVHESFPRD